MIAPPNPASHGNIAFYPFHEGAALHLKDSHRLWVLNTTAATLFCLLDGTRDQHQLAREYGQRFNLKSETARKDVSILLNNFTHDGLLEGCPNLKTTVTGQKTPRSKSQPTLKAEPLHHLEHTTFRIAGHWFSLQCSHKHTTDQWRQLLAPLIGHPDHRHPVVELTVLPDPSNPNNRMHCWRNNQLTTTGLLPENIIPHLVYQVFEHVSAHTQSRLLIHAAVLAHKEQTFIFPGQTGAGKSTLTAALTQSGWTYLSDELAILDPNTLQVEPYAMPIGLKTTSTAALSNIIPDLPSNPSHQRDDGKNIRYWMPDNLKEEGPHPITALIFPQYRPKAKTQLNKLNPLEALKKLTATGSSKRPIKKPDIQALLSLAQKPSYDLRHSNIEEATEEINKLMISNKIKSD